MRRKVAIIGGGIAGLTTAHELTRTAAERNRWDVTVYEMGHRFGGRLASAHQPEKWGRNEEHGLHVWFGFYDNVFRLAEEVWRDFPRPEGCPWTSIWEGLRPIYSSDHGLVDDDGRPLVRRVHYPRNGARPGDTALLSFVGVLTGLIDAVRALSHTLLEAGGDGPTGSVTAGAPFFAPAESVTALRELDRALDRLASRALSLQWLAPPALRRSLAGGLERIARAIHRPVVSLATRVAGRDPARRSIAHALDVALGVLRAVTSPRHGIPDDGDLDRVSHLELRELLGMHGVHAETLENGRIIEALYDMPFAYRDGDRTQPVMEAGTALRYALRMVFGYKHAIAYLLTAGAGETLVAPLYALLRQRGVRFVPFHRLRSVRIDAAHERIEELELVRAARAARNYDPLCERRGFLSFRAAPNWDELEDGKRLASRGVDFYSRFGDRGEDTAVGLRRGVDFDDVVLALPLGCIARDGDGHSPVEDWLAFFPKAEACLARLHLVPTVAAQVWLSEAPEALDFDRKSVVTWTAPYSVACDMSPVIAHESWPGDAPRTCVYLCGPWPLTAHRATSDDRQARVHDDAVARAELVRQLADDGASLFTSNATLHAPAGVENPWDAQYIRANVEPWDLADLPLPGANAVRLEANETGLRNLALAGSWVRTAVNTTSVEAAVSSGIAAARALGCESQPILGEAVLRRAPRVVRLPNREAELDDSRRRAAKTWPRTEWALDA